MRAIAIAQREGPAVYGDHAAAARARQFVASFFPQTKKADRAQPRAQPARKYGVISRKRSTSPQNIHCIVNIMRLFHIPPPILICNDFIIFSRICQDTISCKKISSRGRGIVPRPRHHEKYDP